MASCCASKPSIGRLGAVQTDVMAASPPAPATGAFQLVSSIWEEYPSTHVHRISGG